MGNCVAPIKPKGLTEHNYPSRYLSNKNTLGRIFDWCITILPLIELYWQMNKPRGAWKTLSDSDFFGGNREQSRLRRDHLSASESDFQIMRCLLYKIRTYFESNPDEE